MGLAADPTTRPAAVILTRQFRGTVGEVSLLHDRQGSAVNAASPCMTAAGPQEQSIP